MSCIRAAEKTPARRVSAFHILSCPVSWRRRTHTWIADLLPSDFWAYVAGLIDQGMAVMKKTLEFA